MPVSRGALMVPFGSRSQKNKRQSVQNSLLRKKLTFENLESRELLAADMAEIIGTVLNDLQGDGNASNDIAVAGAGVTLYRDGGNGIFGGDDAHRHVHYVVCAELKYY